MKRGFFRLIALLTLLLSYVQQAEARGLKVLIAGAGAAAHLAGVLAAHTVLPVIGVPIDSSPLKGLDALLSTVQMPPGVPVGCMGSWKSGSQECRALCRRHSCFERWRADARS